MSFDDDDEYMAQADDWDRSTVLDPMWEIQQTKVKIQFIASTNCVRTRSGLSVVHYPCC